MIVLDDKKPKTKYSFIGKFFHWSFLALFAYGFAKQVEDIKQLETFFF